MAEMQTLKVDFSDIPNALPLQWKTLRVDFSDIPDAEPTSPEPKGPATKDWLWDRTRWDG